MSKSPARPTQVSQPSFRPQICCAFTAQRQLRKYLSMGNSRLSNMDRANYEQPLSVFVVVQEAFRLFDTKQLLGRRLSRAENFGNSAFPDVLM